MSIAVHISVTTSDFEFLTVFNLFVLLLLLLLLFLLLFYFYHLFNI